MVVLLCRNRVIDYVKWKAVFDSHAQSHLESGLKLTRIWRSLDDPNNVFFTFEVIDMDRARTFISDAPAAEAAVESGVIDGEFHFVEESESY